MRTAFTIVIVLVSFSSHVFSQLSLPINRSSDENEILKSISEISRAYVARNPEPFDRIYLENYVSIRGKPVFNIRDQLIAMLRADAQTLRAGKPLDFDTISYESENPRIHFYGQTAIVNIYKKNLWRYRNNKCLTKTQATELWLKREGIWRLAAGHMTTFQCEKKPSHPVHLAVAAIPPQTKAPANNDPDAGNQIRNVINEIANARVSEPELLQAILDRYVTKDFVGTNSRGEIVRDRSVFASLPLPITRRRPGLRSQDDAILVYGDSAILTFRVPPASASAGSAADDSQQCTIILVRIQGKWLIAATHISRIGAD